MDYRKINSHIVLILIIFIVGLTIAMLGRLIMLDKGFDAGTANLTFVIVLGVCIIGYLMILGTLAHTVIPWIMKKLPKKKTTPAIIQEGIPDETTFDGTKCSQKEETPKQSIEEIREASDRRYLEKQTSQINLFIEYSHLTMAPFVTNNELLRLDEAIQCYARGESLLEDFTPINPKKLKNPDLFHFGWNMAHYFDQRKQDVVPWLKQVFAELRGLEYSYIKGKLHDSQTKKHTIPNIDDIPGYLAKQSR